MSVFNKVDEGHKRCIYTHMYIYNVVQLHLEYHKRQKTKLKSEGVFEKLATPP